MRIGVTFDLQRDPLDLDQAEFDPPDVIVAIQNALRHLGHVPVLLDNATAVAACVRSREDQARFRERFDLVLNIAEGSGGRCREAWVPAMFEVLEIPFVGSGSATLALGLDKALCKRLAFASGVPTPPWKVVHTAADLPAAATLGFPVIVKPLHEGSGVGIDPDAVARDGDSLARAVERLWKNFRQPALVERFIAFGELTVFLIGNDPVEALPVIQRSIEPVSRLAYHVAIRPGETAAWYDPLEITPALEERAKVAAVRMFETLRCRDMARVDLRVDEDGNVTFIEINPLPSLHPEQTVGLLAEHMGITYADFLGRILDAAIKRLGLNRPGQRQ